MNDESAIPASEASHGHPRTAAALQRLRQAMATIEAEIEAQGGHYPYNHGRMTQSELCRRADVKKATLQNPVHKDTTRVEVMDWCDAINARLMLAKDAARLGSSAVMPPDACGIKSLQQQLDIALQRIAALEQENALLRERLAGN